MEPRPTVEHKRPPGQEDSTLATVLRFGLEVVAWFSIQQVWGWDALVVAVLLLALFRARGDAYGRGIVVPGVVRVVLEIGLLLVGTVALGMWAPPWATVLMVGGIALYLVVGLRRYGRLMRR